MNNTERQALKAKIIAELTTIRQDIADLKELTKPIAPENAIGRVSRMDAINNKSVNEATLRRTKMKAKKLETALSKIDSPKFGICTSCKRTIQAARLMFIPESMRCVRCAR